MSAVCACVPGVRCESCRQRSAAVRRLLCAAPDERQRYTDPVGWADRFTSLQDARAALCLAVGVPVELIHPASGHDLSRRHDPTT